MVSDGEITRKGAAYDDTRDGDESENEGHVGLRAAELVC